MALIDFDEALNFYRGNALIDTLGMTLGITSEQLDKFFETNDYTVLLDDPRRSEATSEVEPTNDPSLTQEEPKETPSEEPVEEEPNIENLEEV